MLATSGACRWRHLCGKFFRFFLARKYLSMVAFKRIRSHSTIVEVNRADRTSISPAEKRNQNGSCRLSSIMPFIRVRSAMYRWLSRRLSSPVCNRLQIDRCNRLHTWSRMKLQQVVKIDIHWMMCACSNRSCDSAKCGVCEIWKKEFFSLFMKERLLNRLLCIPSAASWRLGALQFHSMY